jgi:hypothetical protein
MENTIRASTYKVTRGQDGKPGRETTRFFALGILLAV